MFRKSRLFTLSAIAFLALSGSLAPVMAADPVRPETDQRSESDVVITYSGHVGNKDQAKVQLDAITNNTKTNMRVDWDDLERKLRAGHLKNAGFVPNGFRSPRPGSESSLLLSTDVLQGYGYEAYGQGGNGGADLSFYTSFLNVPYGGEASGSAVTSWLGTLPQANATTVHLLQTWNLAVSNYGGGGHAERSRLV